MLSDSFDLFERLWGLNLLKDAPEFWWPNYGTFEVVLGAVLTQNTKFEKVEISLERLKEAQLDRLEQWAGQECYRIIPCITPSGLYRQKSERLITLTANIIDTFGSFEDFSAQVDRAWLLSQKGIGPESADAILCYACKRDAMVVDSYTARLLSAFGYEFDSYEMIQEWLQEGLYKQEKKLQSLYQTATDRARIYAHFHGMIVEYCKLFCKSKKVDINPLL